MRKEGKVKLVVVFEAREEALRVEAVECVGGLGVEILVHYQEIL